MLLNLLSVMIAYILFWGVGYSANRIYGHFFFGGAPMVHLIPCIFAIFLVPMGGFGSIYICGGKVKWWYIVVAVLGMFASIPVSVWLLDFTSHIGGADIIHAIKSGFLLTFWYFFAGLLLVGLKSQALLYLRKQNNA